MLAIAAIKNHRNFFIEHQRYLTKRKDKFELWKRMIERRSQDLEKRFLDEHKALKKRQDMDRKRTERLKSDKARREKKAKLRIKLNEKRRLQKQQSDEAAAAELERQRLEAEENAKRRAANHAAVAVLNQERALAELAEMQAQQEAERKMLQIKQKQAVVNAERTSYRQQELALKQQERETQRMLAQIRKDKQRKRLEELKEQNPYHESVQQMTTDTDRLNRQTAAFKNAVDQSEVDATLFKKHGYSDKELFKDIRFKIGMAMRAAGLNKGYAKQVLSQMTSSRPTIVRNLRSQI